MKNVNRKRLTLPLFSMLALLMSSSMLNAQQDRPQELICETANAALQDFKNAELNLVDKKAVKDAEVSQIYEENFGTFRNELVAKLKQIVLEETQNGSLNDAVEIRSAVEFFEKLKPTDPSDMEGRPRKLSAASAQKALVSFKISQRDLIKKRERKDKETIKFLEEAHEKLRDELLVKLEQSLAKQATAGKLDEALEIRSAVAYFEKIELGVIDAQPANPAAPAAKTKGPHAQLTNSIGMKFSLIPAGEFLMGSETQTDALVKSLKWKGTNQFPQHKVLISKPFYMGTYEVTVGDFRKFVDATGYQTLAESSTGHGYDGDKKFIVDKAFSWQNTGFEQTDDHPVTNVTWKDAVRFCQWLSEKEKVQYQLPSEAQWEYACRAGSTSMFYNGDDFESVTKIANVADTSWQQKLGKKNEITTSDDCIFTSQVGKYLPNQFGLHDMTGNVAELCQDWFQKDYYGQSPAVDPIGPDVGEKRVLRGGGWGDSLFLSRAACRRAAWPTLRSVQIGFRVVRIPN